MHHWVYLIIAIVSEVVATSALKASTGFSKPLPSALVVVGYLVSFLLSFADAEDHSGWHCLRHLVRRGCGADLGGGLAVVRAKARTCR